MAYFLKLVITPEKIKYWKLKGISYAIKIGLSFPLSTCIKQIVKFVLKYFLVFYKYLKNYNQDLK